mmetsp:Transcript_19424/g.40716  ORF Transcript_19424/g.40716 Transcript_19424/m.40716 type:complete len:87 (-) Transcript_19424:1544-1804(-)
MYVEVSDSLSKYDPITSMWDIGCPLFASRSLSKLSRLGAITCAAKNATKVAEMNKRIVRVRTLSQRIYGVLGNAIWYVSVGANQKK